MLPAELVKRLFRAVGNGMKRAYRLLSDVARKLELFLALLVFLGVLVTALGMVASDWFMIVIGIAVTVTSSAVLGFHPDSCKDDGKDIEPDEQAS